MLRHWTVALPTVLVIAITLSMFHSLLAVRERSQGIFQMLQQKFEITVYLKDNADPFEIGTLITALEERADVTPPVLYTSKEAAWEKFKKTFSLGSELSDAYRVSLPASIQIKPAKPEDAPRIYAFLAQEASNLLKDPFDAGKQEELVSTQVLEFIQQTYRNTVKTLTLFIFLFALGSIVLLACTVSLGTTSRHLEMSIMKLVGAERSFISAPFVTEGVFLGFFGFLIFLVLLLLSPFQIQDQTLFFNALLLEFFAALAIPGAVSALTTFFYDS